MTMMLIESGLWKQLNDDILWEVLIRLPCKSLAQSKCVSKQWNSIIRNPGFAKAYASRCRYHGLIFYRHTRGRPTFSTSTYAFSNNNLQGSYQLSLKHHLDDDQPPMCTCVVNGMICFYWLDKPMCALLNVVTGELLDIPFFSRGETLGCYLGFDPLNRVYKVLRNYCPGGIQHYQEFFEICTIGGVKDSSWRCLYLPVSVSFGYAKSTCINGNLYFLGLITTPLPGTPSLVGLDLRTETFKTIPMGEDLISSLDTYMNYFELLQLGGRIAIIFVIRYYCVTIWMMNNDNNTWLKGSSVNLGIEGVSYVGTLSTGEILLAPGWFWKKNPILVYKYNHMENKLQIWGAFSNDNDFGFAITRMSYDTLMQ